MNKPCRAFPSEYQSEYTKKKAALRKPYPLTLDWDDGDDVKPLDHDEAEKLLKKLILDNYNSLYRVQYQDRSKRTEPQEEDEFGMGNELVAYINKLYFDPPPKKVPRVPYTATRVLGYSSPETLRATLSSYQDSYSRVGGAVILKNLRKMVATAKRTRIIQRITQQMEAEQMEEQLLFDE